MFFPFYNLRLRCPKVIISYRFKQSILSERRKLFLKNEIKHSNIESPDFILVMTRHDLSFTGYVRRPCVKDVSGPKRSRLLGSNYQLSGTVTPDGSAELHK